MMFGDEPGSGAGGMDNESLRRMMIPPPPAEISADAGDDDDNEFRRVPQWSQQETQDFIAIKAELERDFTFLKRNKTLWESVSARMKGLGYRRTAEQCKCKWKSLVNRYKGKDKSFEQDGDGRQFSPFEEMHAIFIERDMNMQQMLIDCETSPIHPKKRVKRIGDDQSPEYLCDFEDVEEEEGHGPKVASTMSPRKRKGEKEKQEEKKNEKGLGQSSGINNIQYILRDFLQQQERIETLWRQSIEKYAYERQMFVQEWQQSMEKMAREGLMVEQAWREREEQRRMREESRAEKRDALLTTLLNKLIHEPHHP